MNVVCIGSGYVGSVTGAAFAALGHKTTVIDVDQNKVDLINSGKSPIYEPGLEELINDLIGKTLFATTSYRPVYDADVVFIGVGTPSKEDGTADLKYIELAAKSIGLNLNPNRFTVIVNKSTVPVGTAEIVSSIIEDVSGLEAEEAFSVVSNPEFLREGFAVEDVFFPDRIVIGTSNDKAKSVMKELYEGIIKRHNYASICKYFQFEYNLSSTEPIYFETDTKSSEMIKYASNAFLAVKISYINEIARLCEALGANVLDVAKGMGMDSRIGSKFLEVSSGWSGSCFPKDTSELLATSIKVKSDLSIVKAAIESNYRMHLYVVEKLKNIVGSLKGKNIGILGLTFKPNTDDARKTQASTIIEELLKCNANIKVYDPRGMDNFKKYNPHLNIDYCNAAIEVAIDSDVILLLTHWNEFLNIDWRVAKQYMRNYIVFDTRNFLNSEELIENGFTYFGLGTKNLRKDLVLM